MTRGNRSDAPAQAADQAAVRHRPEWGISSLQYVGLLLLAAVVVSTIALTLSTGDVRAQICKAYGMITQQDVGCAGDSGDDGDDQATEPTDQDFEPEKCKLHETGDEYSSVIKIGFIEIGENAGFVVTEYSDGTVTMMATNGAEIGATGGFGADAAYGQLEAGASVDFGGGLKFDYGSTWSFESMEQAEQFREQLDDYLMDQWSLAHPVCGPTGICFPRPLTGAEPPPVPSTTFGGIALTGDVTGQLGISLTSGTTPMTQTELTQQGVVAQIGGEAHWTVTNDNNGTPDDPSDDTRTYVTDMSLNSELTGQIALATGGTGSMVGMSYSVKKDADGNIIEVQIVSTSQVDQQSGATGEGEVNQGEEPNQNSAGGSVTDATTNGDVVVTETTLVIDPNDTASQQIVQDWMGGNGDFAYPGLIPLNMINPAKADPDNPMAMLMHNNATSSTIAYDNVTDVQGFALNVKFGLAFGVDFSTESSETTATEATYLGAPRPDGTRPVLDYTECVS